MWVGYQVKISVTATVSYFSQYFLLKRIYEEFKVKINAFLSIFDTYVLCTIINKIKMKAISFSRHLEK